MKPHFSNQKNHAMTLVEVIVVIVVLVFLAALLLPITVASSCNKCQKISCRDNLLQIDLAYRVWAGDNGDKYPMQTSVTNGGTMELVNGNNAWINFAVMSNELSTPKILICPEDQSKTFATNFTTDFNNSHVSYFVGLDADEDHPQMFLSGDDNFEIGGVPVKSGLLELTTKSDVAWTSSRHFFAKAHFWTLTHLKPFGNIGLADGSVQQLDNSGLTNLLQQTGLATNRLAIP
jgi:type II secretory pathway pseudopilin PulG